MRAGKTLVVTTCCLMGTSGCDIVFGLVPGEPNPSFSVSGTIEKDTTWTSDRTPILEGFVRVPDGVTLTIEPGTVILAKTGGGLFIDRGAQIIAKGTADAPIVFTSHAELRAPGDWRGVFLCGKAPINGAPNGEFLMTSIPTGSNLACGGNEPTDSSGVLQYVRIEFSGNDIGADSRAAGLELAGVGSGTLIDHVQIHQTNEDAFNIYGGTVSLKYALVTNHGEDGFDWAYGWQGKMQYVAAIRNDSGFESGNGSNDAYNDIPSVGPSNPMVYNATLIGYSGNGNTGLTFGASTQGKFHNLLVADFSEFGIEMVGTGTANNAIASALEIRNSVFSNLYNFAPMTFPDGSSLQQWINDPMRKNQALPDGKHGIRSLDPTNLDLSLMPGAPGFTEPATPPNDGFFDQSATFIGVCGDSCPEFQGWTNFETN